MDKPVQYTIRFSVLVGERLGEYGAATPVNLEVKENLPRNVDPQAYLRKRLAEELRRAFAAGPKLENFDKGTEEDPLAAPTDDIPF
jgi:hypothetical protein